MKIDIAQHLIGYDGEPIQDGSDGPLTLRSVCCSALVGNYSDEQALPGEDKVRRFCLAQRLHSCAHPELTVEEIALIKLLIAKGFVTSVVGSAWSKLDP